MHVNMYANIVLVLCMLTTVACQTCPMMPGTQRHFDGTGYYNQRCDATLCSLCSAGTYIDPYNDCYYCAAGKYSQYYGATICDNCSVGTYSNSGATACITCPLGTYSSTTGASSCQACTPGYYADTVTSCKICNNGTYSNGNMVSCSICFPGSYSLSGASACTACNPGFYNSIIGSTTCKTCEAGTYTSSTGPTSCIACLQNTWSAPGSSSCSSCTGEFNCSLISYYSAMCAWCPEGSYRTTNPSTYCSANPTKLVTACTQCLQHTNCNTGTYLNYNCTGTETTQNACLSCSTSKCSDINKYRTPCTSTANSVCTNTYTQCSSGYYLKGFEIFKDGVCEACIDCLDARNITIPCSQYVAQVCTGPCNTWAPCEVGVCIYKYNDIGNNMCIDCPTGYTRDNSLCRRSSTSTICANGMYYNFFDRTCKTCIQPALELVAITHGLYDNDATTCVWETKPGGYGNQVGFYGTTACAALFTAEANNAQVSSDCKACPQTPPGNIITYTNARACIWRCQSPYTMVGNTCLLQDESEICGGNGLRLNASKKCIFSAIPWQKHGYVYISDVYVIQGNPTNSPVQITYNPFRYNMNGYILTSIERTTYAREDHNYIEVNYNDIQTTGLVCSAAIDNNILYVVYCNVSMIFYMDDYQEFNRLILSLIHI